MAYPDTRKFSDAVLNPGACFNDPELATGRVALHPRMRTPLAWPGKFASVYQVTAADGQNFAVRCFKSEVRDHQSRYHQLSQYLRSASPPGFVEFDYQPRGIRVSGEWYPIVKMEWVDGRTLDKFVDDNLHKPSALKRISNQWREIASELQRSPAAHNDLQHGNIIIQPDESIRLVDYDGIFLPQFQGNPTLEEGHSNYQHPQRSFRNYDEHIDNFPAIVIYLSLLAVAADPDLWARYYNGENLIFTESDFAQPQNSRLFQTLKSNGDATIRNLTALLEDCCARPVAETPTLENALQPNGATQRKPPTSPTSYRQLLQERQQESNRKIDAQDFIRFCIRLDGQELRTLRNVEEFRVGVNQTASTLHFIPVPNRQTRACGLAEVKRFLDQFEITKSWSTKNYLPSVTNNASYLLVVLDYYLRFATQFQAIQDELQSVWQLAETDHAAAELKYQALQNEMASFWQQFSANKTGGPSADELWEAIAQTAIVKNEFAQKTQAAQDELRAVQRQADADKSESDKKLKAAQDELRAVRRQADADKSESDKKLKAAQDELRAVRRQAAADKAEEDRKLKAAQDELRAVQRQAATDKWATTVQATIDKNEFEQKIQAALDELQTARQQTAYVEATLKTTQGEVRVARQQTADAEAKLQTAQAQAQSAQRQTADTYQKLRSAQAELQAAQQQTADAEAKLQSTQAALQTARQETYAAEAKFHSTQAALQAAQQRAANSEAKLQSTQVELQIAQQRASELEKYRNSWFGGKLKR